MHRGVLGRLIHLNCAARLSRFILGEVAAFDRDLLRLLLQRDGRPVLRVGVVEQAALDYQILRVADREELAGPGFGVLVVDVAEEAGAYRRNLVHPTALNHQGRGNLLALVLDVHVGNEFCVLYVEYRVRELNGPQVVVGVVLYCAVEQV